LSADTIVPRPSDPQSLNRYAFVVNNPLKYVDPSGHEPKDPCPDNWCNVTPVGLVQSSDFAADLNMRSLYLWLKAHPSYHPARDSFFDEIAPVQRHWIVMKWVSMQPAGRGSLKDTITVVTASILGAGSELGADDDGLITPGGNLPRFTGKKTSGLLMAGGRTFSLSSGRSGPASNMPTDAPGMTEDMIIRDHVEAHAAATMRQEGLSNGELWINNPSGPCLGNRGCDVNLPHMLPEGAKLTVHYPDGDAGWISKSYVGLPDSDWRWP
jgi:hypothetical protein